jgi:nicotinate-nucleotide adenylyltransferase
MRVGLLGGTFDPPHRGHIHVARMVQRALGLHRVLFAPCRWQPLKELRPAAPGAHRAAMVALATAGRSDWILETAELERPGPSYTVETLLELRLRWPGASFTLILGEDSFRTLDRWHRAAELAGLCDVAVVPRFPGAPAPGKEDSAVRWVRAKPFAVSSTLVRERLASGADVSRLIPASVEAYIRKEGLYGCPAPGAPFAGGRPT